MRLRAVNRVILAAVLSCLMTSVVPVWGASVTVTKEGSESTTTTTTIKTPVKETKSTTTVVTKANKDTHTVTTTKTTTITTKSESKSAAKATDTKNSATASNSKSTKGPAFNTPQQANIPAIRVLLVTRSSTWPVAGSGQLAVYTSNKSPFAKFAATDTVTIGVKNNKVTVNGKTVDGSAYIKSWQGNVEGTILLDSKPYRGAIKIVPTSSGGMMLINEVSIEEYLYGVVPAEVSPSWPQEALKAQAVAARTYALYNMKQSAAKAYDVQPTTNHQVYNGQAAEFNSTTKAVDDTKGMVVQYKGQPIEALFHSNAGGYTENSENVWGSNVPYLRGVKDYADYKQSGDSFAWTVKLTRAEMEAKLRVAGKDVGTLKEIKLSTLRQRPMKFKDRGVSGRVMTADFVGNKKTLTLTGETIMKIFGLKSTLFDFYVNVKVPSTADSFKNPKAYHTFKKATDTVSIRGYGWGHGLGLSQWGAAAMAAKAPTSAKDYYKTILTHYYTGVTIDKAY